MGYKKPTGNKIVECPREPGLFSSVRERKVRRSISVSYISCMVIYEEVGPRWDEDCRRGEKGEEPRCCEFRNEEVARGQCQMERRTRLCSLLAATAIRQAVSPP